MSQTVLLIMCIELNFSNLWMIHKWLFLQDTSLWVTQLQSCAMRQLWFRRNRFMAPTSSLLPKVLGLHFSPPTSGACFPWPEVSGINFSAAPSEFRFSVTHFPEGAVSVRALMVSNSTFSSCHSKPPFGEAVMRNFSANMGHQLLLTPLNVETKNKKATLKDGKFMD